MPHSPLELGKVRDWRPRALRMGTALPQMKAPCSGHIVNVRSVAGHVVRPGSAVHAATKTAVRDLRRPAAGGQALEHPHHRHLAGCWPPNCPTA
jgi:hypothetical protein